MSGASGMQVQPLVPWRSVFALPLASIVTIDALCAIDVGAADSALWIGSFEAAPVPIVATELSAAAGFPLVFPALLHAPSARIAAPTVSAFKYLDAMSPSF